MQELGFLRTCKPATTQVMRNIDYISEVTVSKKGGGTNRVCFKCRLKFPSKFTDDSKNTNITNLCCNCGNELSLIPDSYIVPKKTQFKEWLELEANYHSGWAKRRQQHSDLYPEHKTIDMNLHLRRVRVLNMARFEKIVNDKPAEVFKAVRFVEDNFDLFQEKSLNLADGEKTLIISMMTSRYKFCKKCLKNND
ncbi:hypothetical protein [Photobacterium kishitanii]|uniref:Uncharacterized protein n=1 Tax=Photobacterium kishitanii TaxID=318456 RepID=A0A2T3KL77_9GAMM|nr:hypothetical protein [Photobacterium kishitanii]PSV00426.1 hypothetical protein C9J27_04660 [Photobacterium kishitanii]